jgi:hypothetical protein
MAHGSGSASSPDDDSTRNDCLSFRTASGWSDERIRVRDFFCCARAQQTKLRHKRRRILCRFGGSRSTTRGFSSAVGIWSARSRVFAGASIRTHRHRAQLRGAVPANKNPGHTRDSDVGAETCGPRTVDFVTCATAFVLRRWHFYGGGKRSSNLSLLSKCGIIKRAISGWPLSFILSPQSGRGNPIAPSIVSAGAARRRAMAPRFCLCLWERERIKVRDSSVGIIPRVSTAGVHDGNFSDALPRLTSGYAL